MRQPMPVRVLRGAVRNVGWEELGDQVSIPRGRQPLLSQEPELSQEPLLSQMTEDSGSLNDSNESRLIRWKVLVYDRASADAATW
jgi:hypothetical protein